MCFKPLTRRLQVQGFVEFRDSNLQDFHDPAMIVEWPRKDFGKVINVPIKAIFHFYFVCLTSLMSHLHLRKLTCCTRKRLFGFGKKLQTTQFLGFQKLVFGVVSLGTLFHMIKMFLSGLEPNPHVQCQIYSHLYPRCSRCGIFTYIWLIFIYGKSR